MDSPLNPSARFSSVTSAATVSLHGSPHLKTCKQLHIWKPLDPMTTVWLAFDYLYLYMTLTIASIGTFSTSPENESNDVVPNMVVSVESAATASSGI